MQYIASGKWMIAHYANQLRGCVSEIYQNHKTHTQTNAKAGAEQQKVRSIVCKQCKQLWCRETKLRFLGCSLRVGASMLYSIFSISTKTSENIATEVETVATSLVQMPYIYHHSKTLDVHSKLDP